VNSSDLNVVALAGGVGGARLADGLAQVLQPEHLTIVVNTGDDFIHFGLHISPDLDTVCYTLANLANPETGWGRIHETWTVFENLKRMGMPDWFQLGDADLATHLVRTIRLSEGWPLSQITADFCNEWGIKVKVLPMSDDAVRTWVCTMEGDLEFQEYFVHQQSRPAVNGFRFEGIEKSRPATGILEAIDRCDVVIFCPSNPWVSIDPILAVPHIRHALAKKPMFAVSPIIGNRTVKGPAAKMFSEMGIQPSPLAVAQHYCNLLKGIWIDNSDNGLVGDINMLGIQTYMADILMHDRQDRSRLAQEVIDTIKVNTRG
jgi:LPPG:FO 2-phospho-L-lactate transferase